MLAISLYAGLRGAAAGRRAMFLMPLAWLAGGLVGLMFSRIPPSSCARPVIPGGRRFRGR